MWRILHGRITSKPDRVTEQIRPVLPPSDPECRAGLPGSAAEIQYPRSWFPWACAKSRHDIYPLQGLHRPYQDSARTAFPTRDHIAAVMHSVGEVDVQVATVPEHHLVPRCHAAESVTCRVAISQVRLHLDNAADEEPVLNFPYEEFPGQIAGDCQRGPTIECAGEFGQVSHALFAVQVISGRG
jgi:hypothetical protein